MTTFRKTSLSAALLFTLASHALAQAPRKLEAIRRLLEDEVGKKRIAGAVAMVSHRGQVRFLEAVGMQDAAAGKPMARDTIFRICSMTKPVTSLAVMVLEEDGKLSLADPLSKFVPEFKGVKVAEELTQATGGAAPPEKRPGKQYLEKPSRREITVLDLLTHTSGLTYGIMGHPHFSKLYQEAGISDGLVETEGTIGDNVKRLAALPLKHHPGEAWEYGLSTDVLGRVVEVASGETLERFFERRIFGPLGMTDTHFRLPSGKKERLAEVYRPRPEGTIEPLPEEPVRNGAAVYSKTYPLRNRGYFSGGAGLVSTVPDYARFLHCLLRGGELDGSRVVKRENIGRMTRDQLGGRSPLFTTHGDRFGLGFGVVSESSPDSTLGSPGTYSWGGFYYTYFWVDPRKELVGVVMAQLHPWGNLTLWNDFRRLAYEALGD